MVSTSEPTPAPAGADDPADLEENGGEMTETLKPEAILEALALIDEGLGQFSERNIITSGEVADLLLDVRRLLTRLEDVSTN